MHGISTKYVQHLCADRGERILPPPPPSLALLANDAARGCELTNIKQTSSALRYLLGRAEAL